MRPRWLDRRIAHPGPFLCLCLSEAEFHRALAHLKVPRSDWMGSGHSHATAHSFEAPEGRGLTVIVCLQDAAGRNPIEVAGLLVHEAVHAWQRYADWIGEKEPGNEQEAYAVQAIAQELMAEFARRVGAGLSRN